MSCMSSAYDTSLHALASGYITLDVIDKQNEHQWSYNAALDVSDLDLEALCIGALHRLTPVCEVVREPMRVDLVTLKFGQQRNTVNTIKGFWQIS